MEVKWAVGAGGQRRHKKKPTLITSNLGFSEWGSFLKNDHIAINFLANVYTRADPTLPIGRV